jgi:hypothetical protein
MSSRLPSIDSIVKFIQPNNSVRQAEQENQPSLPGSPSCLGISPRKRSASQMMGGPAYGESPVPSRKPNPAFEDTRARMSLSVIMGSPPTGADTVSAPLYSTSHMEYPQGADRSIAHPDSPLPRPKTTATTESDSDNEDSEHRVEVLNVGDPKPAAVGPAQTQELARASTLDERLRYGDMKADLKALFKHAEPNAKEMIKEMLKAANGNDFVGESRSARSKRKEMVRIFNVEQSRSAFYTFGRINKFNNEFPENKLNNHNIE